MLSDIGTTLTIHKEQSILGMINEDTPYKLAEIIRDTWPNLYRPPKDYKKIHENQDLYKSRVPLLYSGEETI